MNLVLAGKTWIEAAEAVAVKRRFVGNWLSAFEASGEAAPADTRRGHRPGEQSALNSRQQAMIRRLVIGRCPDQLKPLLALWTRAAAGEPIARRTGTRLSVRPVDGCPTAWGFVAQKPIRWATERDDAAIQAWLTRDYKAIAMRARKKVIEIHWADKTGLSNQASYGRCFAPASETPAIPRPAARSVQSIISSLTNRGTLRLMIYDGALDARLFVRFWRRLIRDACRKLFVIVDNLRVRLAKPVTPWLAHNSEQVERFYLSRCTPECNPDKYVNSDVKQALGCYATPRDKATINAQLARHMRRLQRRPEMVKSFFLAPEVRFAARSS